MSMDAAGSFVGIAPPETSLLTGVLRGTGAALEADARRIQVLLDKAGATSTVPLDLRAAARTCGAAADDLARRTALVQAGGTEHGVWWLPRWSFRPTARLGNAPTGGGLVERILGGLPAHPTVSGDDECPTFHPTLQFGGKGGRGFGLHMAAPLVCEGIAEIVSPLPNGGLSSSVVHVARASPPHDQPDDEEQDRPGNAGSAVPKQLGWTLPKGGGGAEIDGRWYTEHALERMAPDTPQIRAELEARALSRAQAAGLRPGTPEFGEWWAKNGPAPRGVSPTVVEAEIRNPGSTSVRVVTNAQGDVVTVIQR